jgi:hypothetical protein
MIVVIIWPSSESSIGVVRYLSRRPPPHCDGWPSRREMTWWMSHLPTRVFIYPCVWVTSGVTSFQRQQQTANRKRIEIKQLPDKWKAMFPCVWWIESAKEQTWVRELLLFDIPQPNQSGALLADDGDNGNEWTKTDRQFRFAFVCSTHSRERGESLLLWTDRKAERWTVGTRIHTQHNNCLFFYKFLLLHIDNLSFL